MESLNTLLNNSLPLLIGVGVVSGFGYWSGWLFREISPFKIIAWFFILPYPITVITGLNILWLTIPYSLAAIIGFLGEEHIRSQYSQMQRWLR